MTRRSHILGADHIARAIAREVRRVRPRGTPLKVVRVKPPAPLYVTQDNSPVYIVGDDIIGELEAVVADLSAANLPVYRKLRAGFRAMQPASKPVRLDSEKTYGEFLGAQRAPYVADFAERLAALEAAFATHVADGHGARGNTNAAFEEAFTDQGPLAGSADEITVLGEDRGARGNYGDRELVRRGAFDELDLDDDLDVLGEDVARAQEAAAVGGARIPLNLSPRIAPAVTAWQDGENFLCTVNLLGHDGRRYHATTAAPATRYVSDVLGCIGGCADDGDAGEAMLALAPQIIQVLGATDLMEDLFDVTPELLAQDQPFTGQIVSAMEPDLCAAMMLCQLCERGNRAAQYDAQVLCQSSSGIELLSRAGAALDQMRKEKR